MDLQKKLSPVGRGGAGSRTNNESAERIPKIDNRRLQEQFN